MAACPERFRKLGKEAIVTSTMAFVAGAYARSPQATLDQADFESLVTALNAGPGEVRGHFRTARLQLAWRSLDDSCGCPVVGADGSVSLLWGSMYRDGAAESANLEFVRSQLNVGRQPDLQSLSGDFGVVYHDASADVLHLLTDKMAVRPLYYHCAGDKVWFSSSIKVIERLSQVPKVLSLRGVTEMAFFGWSMGERTAYRDVAVMQPGEHLRVDADRVQRGLYWRWDQLPQWTGSREECVEGLADAFRNSIRRRRRKDRRVISLLSGGLDSRMIAAVLREQQAEVHTYNFSPAGTQDHVYGELAAQALGCRHRSPPLARGRTPNLYEQLSEVLRQGQIDSAEAPERSHWVSVGVGGSTGFGAVFWDQRLLDLFRGGQIRDGVEEYFRRLGWSLVEKLYPAKVLPRIREMLVEGILEQMQKFQYPDPARTFHLFIMMNDQRRHLYPHWENAALHGLQFHVPFMDSHFLERMLVFPMEWALGHDLYYQWMERLPAAARSTPWQVYPGHKPCPVPPVGSAVTQWAADNNYDLRDLRQWRQIAGELLAMRPFPAFFSRSYLRIVRMQLALGRDYSYALRAALVYKDPWKHSGGEYEAL